MNESLQHKLLEKIQQSQEFSSSSIYGNYLDYLVKSAIEGKILKETTIAIEFFSKDADFNPSEDTIVRSHTYKLRKKLERYYFTEGKEDIYRFNIPKGHYEIHFTKIDPPSALSPKIISNFQKNIFYLILLAFFLITIYLVFLNRQYANQLKSYKTVAADDFIWQEFISSNLPILVVPGDHFLFNMQSMDLNKEISVRDINVNSIADFKNLENSFPDKNFTVSPEPYFPYHSIWTLPPILSILYSYNKRLIMRKASVVSPQMLDEYNIIFLGSIKTLYSLTHIVSRTHFSFSIAPHQITYSNPDSNTINVYSTNTHSTGPNEDLVLVLKLPGPVNNSIIIIASYHSLGAPEIANLLTDPQQKVQLQNLILEYEDKLPQYFESLFRVTGIDKTAYKTELLEFRGLTANELSNQNQITSN